MYNKMEPIPIPPPVLLYSAFFSETWHQVEETDERKGGVYMLIRRMAAGFLAGASSVASILAIFVLLLFAAGFWSLLRDISFQVQGNVSFWSALGQALVQSLRALPQYFWSARWGMFALGLLGLGLALVDAQRPRIQRPWRDYLGFVATLGVVTAVVIGTQFGNREAIHSWIADQPILFDQQEVLLVSDTTLLSIGILIALALGYIVYVAWDWWYNHWAAWLHIERPAKAVVPTPEPVPTVASEAMEYQARMARLRRQTTEDERPAAPTPNPPAASQSSRSWLRILLASLAAATLLTLLCLGLYNTVGPAVMSGELWVTAAAPQAAVSLPFSQAPRRLTLSNAGGVGTVNIRLSTGTGEAPLRGDSLLLAGTADQYQTSDIPLTGLKPGDYVLQLSLQAGQGGLVRYVALYGGGVPGQLTAAILGLAVGVWLSIAIILLLELLAERGWINNAAAEGT